MTGADEFYRLAVTAPKAVSPLVPRSATALHILSAAFL
jgi:hypothetical protein